MKTLQHVSTLNSCMGARRHGQEGAFAHPPPSGNVVKCFRALVVTAKRSVDESFTHHFHNLLSASLRPPPELHPWTPLGDFRPQTANLPTPGKILRAPMNSCTFNLSSVCWCKFPTYYRCPLHSQCAVSLFNTDASNYAICTLCTWTALVYLVQPAFHGCNKSVKFLNLKHCNSGC